jgi:hypothetical protein
MRRLTVLVVLALAPAAACGNSITGPTRLGPDADRSDSQTRPLTGFYNQTSHTRPLTGFYNQTSHTRPLTGFYSE